jgi:hypothetical protein
LAVLPHLHLFRDKAYQVMQAYLVRSHRQVVVVVVEAILP